MMRFLRRLQGGHWEHWIVEDDLGVESWVWLRVEQCFFVTQERPHGAVPGSDPLDCETW